MNIFYKAYCRLYQLCFKIALPFLPYRKPIILDSEDAIIDVLKEKSINSVLIATGKGIVNAGLLSPLTDILDNSDIRYVIYDGTVPNPTIDNIEKARKIYIDNKLCGIIAIGGGSVLDLAKIVGARVVKPNKNVNQMKGLLKIRKKIPLLIAVPTTSGTGSEVTIAAVITDNKTHHKYPINDFCLIPEYAVLDYRNTLGLPKSITSTTGMDALTHAVEAYVSNTRTKETKKMSLTAIKLIVENITVCYHNPDNKEARKNMLYASHYAGIAFTKAYVGYVHAIAHALGGKYNIAHGLANAIILPIILEEYGPSVYKKIKEIAIYSGLATNDDSPKIATEKFIKWIYAANKEMDIPINIASIKEKDIDEIASFAIKEANPLYPVPKLMNKNEIKRIIYKIKFKNEKTID